jgi:hypothetical protein
MVLTDRRDLSGLLSASTAAVLSHELDNALRLVDGTFDFFSLLVDLLVFVGRELPASLSNLTQSGPFWPRSTSGMLLFVDY